MNETFYVGYQERAPESLAVLVRRRVVMLALAMVVGLVGISVVQSPVGSGRFEFGVRRQLEGLFFEDPIPFLQVTMSSGEIGSYVLVGAGKFGIPAFARGHHGHRVRVSGTIIERDGQHMLELNDPASFAVLDGGGHALPESTDLGEVRVVGELVDTKCYSGAMRPATGKVHRACAVRCLSGGVPPGLLVRESPDVARVLWLAQGEGGPWRVDPQWAARHLEVRGRLRLVGGLPVLTVAGWQGVDGP